MKSQPTVLFIDDNKYPTTYYIEELEADGFKVRHTRDPDSAFDFIGKTKPEAVVLDIMMPPGRKYHNKDTEGGIMTGLFIYNDIRILYPKMPIIILTNVTNTELLKLLPKDSNLMIANKIDYLPEELVQTIHHMLEVDK